MLNLKNNLESFNLSKTDFLIFSKFLEEKDFNSNLETFLTLLKGRKIDILEEALRGGIITKKSLQFILETHFNVKFSSFERINISNELKERLSKALCLKELFFPLFEDETKIHIAKRYILEDESSDEIQRLLQTEKEIILFFETSEKIKDLIFKEFREPNLLLQALKPLQEKLSSYSKAEITTIKDPITNFIEILLEEAAVKNASKIYLETKEHFVQIFFEINESLEEISFIEKENWTRVLSKIKMMFSLKVAENFITQKADLKIKIGSEEMLFSASVYPAFFGENVTILITKKEEILPIEDVGISKNNLQKIIKLSEKKEGIILILGQKNSAKSMLYSLGDFISTKNFKVCILENELLHTFPNFIKVNSLEGFLASHSDVILTLHSDVLSLHKAAELGLKKAIIYGGIMEIINAVKQFRHTNLAGALNQKALRKLCECKKEVDLKPEDLSLLRLAKTDVRKIYTAVGCKNCNNTGYFGKTLATEILLLDLETEEIFDVNSSKKSIFEELKRKGFASIFEDARLKVLQGITDISEIKRVMGL
jgi:type II secretory ATPase GspE/PulE/Tfp pilus assembly ATPase PilB-like protein